MSLTKKDLEQIAQIFNTWGKQLEIRLEQRITENVTKNVSSNIINTLTKILDEKLAIQTDQILEYVNAFNKSHEEWRRNHEVRIIRLEENVFGEIKQ